MELFYLQYPVFLLSVNRQVQGGTLSSHPKLNNCCM